MKKKNFDAVLMMREIRAKLSDRYMKDPSLENKDLAVVNKKYDIRPASWSTKSSSHQHR